MAKLPEITLPAHLKERLQQGHPWIYRNHLAPQIQLQSGDWVRLRCGGWTGFALWDSKGPIALRIFSWRHLPDQRWLKQRVLEAWQLRQPLRQQGCTAYRWLFGEGDGLPGLTVDLYGEFAVIQTYMESGSVLLKGLVTALADVTPLQGILLRTQHSAEHYPEHSPVVTTSDTPDPDTATKTKLLWGKPAPTDWVVQEYDLKFQANLATGQKTGLFLDHRENRRFVQSLSQDRQVLNCFAYTGAFSLYALRGGAAHVTSADIGKGLAAAAQTNLQLNHFDLHQHEFITADCFDLLQTYVEQGRMFDLVILDPPSFAKTKQNQYAALRAYTKLNALALKCVKEQGMLVSASCTSQISPSAFNEMLAKASTMAGRRLQIVHEAGQPLDHPVPVHFPEGRYLKFVVGRVMNLV
jgi:23S rRNA (cytosine1962-C5)-methyltransferase